MDILNYKTIGGNDCVVFNGPDEQFAAGRFMGADGGIGSTYAPMVELYLEMDRCICENNAVKALRSKRLSRIPFRHTDLSGHLMSSLKTLMSLEV